MSTITLDPVEAVPGLYYGLVTDPKIIQLLEKIVQHGQTTAEPVGNAFGKTSANSRLRKSYGRDYNTSKSLESADAFTPDLETLVDWSVENLGIDKRPNMCLINYYDLKQGIGKHIDHVTFFKETIICFTVTGTRTMRFTLNDQKINLVTAKNSVYIMTGDARYKWSHEMPKLAKNNVCASITFRTLAE